MKKTLLLALAACCLAQVAGAQTVTQQGLTFKLDANSRTATVSDCNEETVSAELSIPSSVSYEGTDYAVTAVGRRAIFNIGTITSITVPSSVKVLDDSCFYYCDKVTSVTLPDGLTYIGSCAMQNMKALTSISVPNSVTTLGESAFYGDKGLTQVSLGNGISEIDDWTFQGCTGLTSFTIPASVQRLGSYVFYGCSKLTKIDVDPASPYLTSVDGVVLSKDLSVLWEAPKTLTTYTVPAAVRTINGGAFRGCTKLTSLTLNDGLKTLGRMALSNCSYLTAIVIPASVETIEAGQFYGDSRLASITVDSASTHFVAEDKVLYDAAKTIVVGALPTKTGDYVLPATVKRIGEFAFNASKIASADLSTGSLTCIEPRGFYGCTALKTVKMGAKLDTIMANAFYGCKVLANVEWPTAVKFIGESAFRNCYAITSVTLPETLKQGSKSIFDGCRALTAIKIPEAWTEIPTYAFYGCSALADVQLPSQLASVGLMAFYNCKALKSIALPSSLQVVGKCGFYGTGLTEVTLPDGCKRVEEMGFAWCKSLTTFTSGSGLEYLGDHALHNNDVLTTVNLNEG